VTAKTLGEVIAETFKEREGVWIPAEQAEEARKQHGETSESDGESSQPVRKKARLQPRMKIKTVSKRKYGQSLCSKWNAG
jgi:hypothetical protein